MEGFEAKTFTSNEGVDPKFLAAKDAFDALIASEGGLEKITALHTVLAEQFPDGSDMQQKAAKYSLYHAIIGSGTPEFTPELIEAYDTPDQHFATLVRTHTGMNL